MANIHPTAIVDSSAEVAEDVEIGAYAVVEADVKIGAGTVLRPHSMVRRYTALGRDNYVDSFVVLGGEPQDLKFSAETVSYLNIGDGNTFREGVTISRATGEKAETRVGSNTYWMANSHAGHNATVDDDVILVNAVLLGGHTHVHRGAILGGGSVVHQFCRVGERVMTQGGSALSMHLPPYCILTDTNCVVSLNSIGLRRASDLDDRDRREIREAFSMLYRSDWPSGRALEEMDKMDWQAAAGRFREFVRNALKAEKPYNRGLCPRLGRLASRRG